MAEDVVAARVAGLEAEVDAACRARAARSRDGVAAERGEVDRHRPRLFLLVLGPRHGQQLVDHVRRVLARAGDLAQRLAQGLGVVLAGLDLALRQLGLRAQAGERRLQLMRGVGEEVLSAPGSDWSKPGQQVDGAHQRRHFLGGAALVDRAQVAAVAAPDPLLQLVQRGDAARQRQPDEQHRDRQVSGTVTVTAPSPPAGTTTTTATGNVKAQASCRKDRTVHLTLLKADGTAASPEVITTTRSNGDFTATITAPAQPAPTPPATTILRPPTR